MESNSLESNKNTVVTVIGAGLAGCEAAWRLAGSGIRVRLIDMKPQRMTPAHSAPDVFAELVCSNSLKSDDVLTAGGLLKSEMRKMGSLILEVAEQTRVPAGSGLAVDRELFAAEVTRLIKSHPLIEIVTEEVSELSSGAVTVVATGPLTGAGLMAGINKVCGQENLSFFDAAAPIITEESIDMGCAFRGARYNKGGDDYINCSLNMQQYAEFYDALVGAETVKLKGFEDLTVFEGCMPIEVMARRGRDALRFGPMRPVGLLDSDGKRPYAVLQLRKEKAAGVLFNMVGFQTNLTFPEQRRVFGLIPALKNAEYVRYGVMHRNSFVRAPVVLDEYSRLKNMDNVFIAGQLSGVEGYVESAVSGILCGINAARLATGKPLLSVPQETVSGALLHYITHAEPSKFQPMNANFGILLPIDVKKKDARYAAFYERSMRAIDEFTAKVNNS